MSHQTGGGLSYQSGGTGHDESRDYRGQISNAGGDTIRQHNNNSHTKTRPPNKIGAKTHSTKEGGLTVG